METSLAESQTDSFFPTKWPNGYPKEKDVSDAHIQRRTITKINHNIRTAWWGGCVCVGGGGVGAWVLKSILRGHNPRPYFCRGFRHIICSVRIKYQPTLPKIKFQVSHYAGTIIEYEA